MHGAADEAGLEFGVHGRGCDNADSGDPRQGQSENSVWSSQGGDTGNYWGVEQTSGQCGGGESEKCLVFRLPLFNNIVYSRLTGSGSTKFALTGKDFGNKNLFATTN